MNGKLAGETVGGQSYAGSDNMTKDVDGGRPMELDMPIQLCSNADNDASHHFDGTIAYLGDHLLCFFFRFSFAATLQMAYRRLL